MIKFNLKAFLIFFIFLLVEITIAIFFKEGFIRHIFGDYLIVFLLYFFFKSFIHIPNHKLAFIVLIISYFIEFIQLTSLLEILHLENNRLAILIMGNTFSISDLLAYTLGYLTLLIFI